MGQPAARVGDLHICPMVTALVPHVGGPVTGPGVGTVLIGGLPAAVLGDLCVCAGGPDTIAKGSAGVMIGGKPAARMGDITAHGGTITLGCMTVLIGDAGSGGGGGGGATMQTKSTGSATAAATANQKSLKDAANNSSDTAHKTNPKDYSAQFTLVDEANKGMENVEYEIETKDGEKHSGKTDSSGKTAKIPEVTTADCRVSFKKK